MSSDKKNSFWLASQFITAVLLSFITLKLNLSYFGNELFGIWILFSSLWGMGTLIDMGLGTAIIKYVARFHKNDEKSEAQKYIFSGFVIFFILGIIIFTTAVLLAELIFFSNPRLVPAEYYSVSFNAFLFLGLNFFLQYLSIFFRSVLEGVNRFVLTSQIFILYNILVFMSVISVILLGLNIVFLAVFYACSSLVILILLISFNVLKVKLFKFKFRLFSVSIFWKIFSYSFSIQIASILGALMDPVIKYVIGNYSSLSFISYYEIARRFTAAASGLFNTSFKNYLPKISILTTTEEIKNYLLNDGARLSRLGITYSGIVYGMMQLVLGVIIYYWFGYRESVLIFILLSIPESVNTFGYSLYLFLLGIGKANILAFLQIINLTVTSITVIFGFKFFGSELGLSGYILSVMLVNMLMLVYINKAFGVTPREYILNTGIGKFIILLFMIGLFLTLIYTDIISFYAGLILLSGTSTIIFLPDLKKYSGMLIKLRMI